MNKRQRRILTNFAVVILITITAAFGMVELKNRVNHSEAMRAMEQLGQMISEYKQKNGSVPPKSYVDEVKKTLQGRLRLGNLRYRARWIEFDSPPEEILAYVEKEYNSLFFRPGAIVLSLGGDMQWMDKKSFKKLLSSQQDQMEIEMTLP